MQRADAVPADCAKKTKGVKRKRSAKNPKAKKPNRVDKLLENAVEAKVPGRVYVYQIKRGLEHPKIPGIPDDLHFNMTSGSRQKVGGEKCTDASPLYLGPSIDPEGKTAATFEGMWQGAKMFRDLGHLDTDGNPTPKYWEDRYKIYDEKDKKGKGARTPAIVKRLKKRAKKNPEIKATPECHYWNGKKHDKFEARGRIYVPRYTPLFAKTKLCGNLIKIVKAGHAIALGDVDGPPQDRFPHGMLASKENIRARFREENPFGHGYCDAMAIQGMIRV